LMNIENDFKKIKINGQIVNLDLSRYLPTNPLKNRIISGKINADVFGTDYTQLLGDISLNDIVVVGSDNKSLRLKSFKLVGKEGTQVESVSDFASKNRKLTYTIDSDWIEGWLSGDFTPKGLVNTIKRGLIETFPTLMSLNGKYKSDDAVNQNRSPLARHTENIEELSEAEYSFKVHKNKSLGDYFNLPVEWLTDFDITGQISSVDDSFILNTNLPYISQGGKKLITGTGLNLELIGKNKSCTLDFSSIIPTKKGDLELDLSIDSRNELFDIYTVFNKSNRNAFYGDVHIHAEAKRDVLTQSPVYSLKFLPTKLYLNNAEWSLGSNEIVYNDNILRIKDLIVRHDNQFIDISGDAGFDVNDKLKVDLADIDLSYIFDTLNINYVQFGGMASGTVFGSDLFSGSPRAEVETLSVDSLSYNGTVLGDAILSARWNNSEKCVEMGADIREGKKRVALMNGGIWVTRDSLSLNFEANKVNVGFLQPFMSAFAEKVEGRASGKALLYGTFKDIDMRGRLFADTIAVKLGFTNVIYSGSDSVIINPGRIEIPEFRLYDKEKNSGIFKGYLTHRFFHDPVFNFAVTDIHSLLCYDTNSQLNPDWYGTIYGSGTASVVGRPGYVGISANVRTERNSDFTFVLTERQDAGEYKFLSFTDKRKEAETRRKALENPVPDFLKEFKQNQQSQEGPPTSFDMQIRTDVTPEATLNIVMDPIAGDKIRANGSGNIAIEYASSSDEMRMFGRYVLDKGIYNFSLQDLILKDFIIKEGSTISFNGNPLDANLNITAAYRVNTNLTDLDKSFANDKELNRTNVPVDALLKVNGEMQNPNIDFDIDLPTLTDETSRKIRSIISTQDMMSRQIIYLLALNRFYTPGYMGTSSNGGEWASVASSTISSQLSSMLGQLSDKVNVMPSLRSDKGDFSDVEVDVALSSSLLNNRLLLNGNFGYRDKTTSNTTFVGDFDIEYLLNSNGNLRLKAYNHFNDQNYYLKSALTTQGLGIIYRKEFDNPFTFLKKLKKSIPKDSIR
ncbi:MAG: translocation/assembly module TamB, partial [Muribaculaceae bacterium]|nr:translocation/assembly module TamB [Muribaculaceae bacterium]